MWDATDYRFSYHSVRRYKGAGGYSRFSYHCAQASTRKLAPEKIDNLGKRRDKGQMKTYNCNGWLNIWAASDNAHVYVQLKDHLCHETYTCIDIPADVKEIVKNNPDMRVSDLWKTKILPLHPKPNFKRKSIYNLHLKEHQARWRSPKWPKMCAISRRRGVVSGRLRGPERGTRTRAGTLGTPWDILIT
ncbi:hypothetical protein FB45DRAFT_917452 [Roridomyces roridus]|uniref:Uncharacterized protein n=1 Tax=Roridomyces roridus TaxID=1738132 RepID=A0AAD7FLS6_9AGAR|nr:hypothetical protein FB45DRAFT_917452 [Roridomyces roridus]